MRKPSLRELLLITVILISIISFIPPGLANEALLWDDKAYINNALIASGRARSNEVWGPHAEERQPLFWWLITGLFMLGLPNWIVRVISPIFGIITVATVYVFVSRILEDPWSGFFSSLPMTFSSFFISTTSDILTDTMGAALAAAYMLSLYMGLKRENRYMLWASGPLLALAIIGRDQNLILIPVTVVFLIWSSALRLRSKISLIAGFLLLFLAVLLMLPIEGLLQTASNILTPLVMNSLFLPLLLLVTGLNAILVTYPYSRIMDDESGSKGLSRVGFDLGLGAALSIVFLYPYFMDNYRLGQEYQIAGRGILSRPISHFIMAKTIGIGAELPRAERWMWWLQHTIQLTTIPILLLAFMGALMMLRERRRFGSLLILWAGFSTAYVIFFTHLEARFLISALPPLFILAGYAISKVTRRRPIIGIGLLTVTTIFLLFPNSGSTFLPDLSQIPPTLQGIQILLGLRSPPAVWLSNYLRYLPMLRPVAPVIELLYPALGLGSLIIMVVVLWAAWRRKPLKG